ncbi:hypothetical protein M422DRAFT_245445 [Sphaerobolus stellatus SS14]|nr:hypothetical protein M422DRAFT_245445 [Sphaerobolus stellatus SS14]
MFSKIAVLSAFVLVAAAAPGGVSQCNTGPTLCCNAVGKADSTAVTNQVGSAISAALQGLSGNVGVGCTEVPVIAGSVGPNCAKQPACCLGNGFNGLVNFGCSPLSV